MCAYNIENMKKVFEDFINLNQNLKTSFATDPLEVSDANSSYASESNICKARSGMKFNTKVKIPKTFDFAPWSQLG